MREPLLRCLWGGVNGGGGIDGQAVGWASQ